MICEWSLRQKQRERLAMTLGDKVYYIFLSWNTVLRVVLERGFAKLNTEESWKLEWTGVI